MQFFHKNFLFNSLNIFLFFPFTKWKTRLYITIKCEDTAQKPWLTVDKRGKCVV